jgi:hypothetical protein
MKTYSEAKELAASYREVGTDCVFVKPDGAAWAEATEVSGGGVFRRNVPVSLTFSATHLGVTFRWELDLEEAGSNGASLMRYDFAACIGTLHKVPPGVRQAAVDILAESAAKIEEYGRAEMAAAIKDFGIAAALRHLALQGDATAKEGK